MQADQVQVDLKKIRRLRIEKGLTQDILAQKLGYETGIGYHYLEKGRCQFKADQLAVVAQLFDVPIEALLIYPKSQEA